MQIKITGPLARLRTVSIHGTIELEKASKKVAINMLMKTESQPVVIGRGPQALELDRPSRIRFGIAFGIAALSRHCIHVDRIRPTDPVADLATAGLLFMILGRRWPC